MSRFLDTKFAALEAYVPGEQPRDKKYIKLNTNESPFPPCPAILDAVNGAAAADLRLYSDPTSIAVKRAIADFYGVSPEWVFVSNGSDESLNFLFMAFCENGAAYADITYGFYQVFADLYQKKTTVVPLEDDFTLDPEKLMATTETLFIANPNAPTGICFPPDVIETIVTSNPDRLVVVDEAYIDFGGESVVPLTQKYDNLAVVQTFSKSRQLAGARLGFTIANPAIIEGLETIKYSTNPYNVNRLTQLCGVLAMEDRAYFDKTRTAIIENRAYTVDELKKRGFTMTDSMTNFIFAKSDKISGKAYYDGLRERGVLVRYFGKARIADYVRITIGSREEMEALIAATDDILANVGE